MRHGQDIWRLCLVTDRELARGRALVDLVAEAAQGGVTMVQLREKEATTRAFLEQARAVRAVLRPLDIPLIINDRIDIALAVEADGAHVGQSDMPAEQARALLGPGRVLGLSIANAEQIARPDVGIVDYLGIGPIFAQSTKPDASVPLGVAGFARLRALAMGKPVLAIGGVKAEHARGLRAAGADGLAIVSAIVAADDPRAAAAAFVREWTAG